MKNNLVKNGFTVLNYDENLSEYLTSYDTRDFKDLNQSDILDEDLNYSFLSRTFSSLSKTQKEKILQILNNTTKIEKVG